MSDLTMRQFDDVPATRDALHQNVMKGLKDRFPIENDKHVLELKDVDWSKYKDFSTKEQLKAIMRNETLGNTINGTMVLKDKETGAVLDTKKGSMMYVPWMTPRGTFIHHGNEYTIVNQARLKPGVYSRTKENGELESHFNVKSGTGPQFRVWMEPETGIFRMHIQQANLKLYPIMKALGYDDEKLGSMWGGELLHANRETPDQASVHKFYMKLAGRKADASLPDEAKLRTIREQLDRAELDPEVTESTLGKRYSKVEPAAIADATQKLLRLNRGEDTVDDRDALQYRTLHSVEDFAYERIVKDAAQLARNLLRKASYQKSLKPIGTAPFSPYMTGLLVGNSLSMPLEEINPLSILEQQHRIVATGEGGISSKDAIPDSAHQVHPSQLGFIDLISGPESLALGVDVRAAHGTLKGSDNHIYGKFRNRHTGKLEWLKPMDVARGSLAFEPVPS
jgi:DNA-directed RNA polymerase beta subunit